MLKIDKGPFVEKLTDELKNSTGYVLVDFNGLTVKLQQELKKNLREIDGKMVIVKNTLFRLSAEKSNAPKEISDTVLEGPSALVVSNADPIALLQILAKFSKDSGIPQFKVGVIEGSFQDKNALIKLASLPGKSVLQSQLVGAVAAPMYGIVGTLQGNIQKLLWILSAKAKE